MFKAQAICTILIQLISLATPQLVMDADVQIESPVLQEDLSEIELRFEPTAWQRCTCVLN